MEYEQNRKLKCIPISYLIPEAGLVGAAVAPPNTEGAGLPPLPPNRSGGVTEMLVAVVGALDVVRLQRCRVLAHFPYATQQYNQPIMGNNNNTTFRTK